jgi:hypothetical protein
MDYARIAQPINAPQTQYSKQLQPIKSYQAKIHLPTRALHKENRIIPHLLATNPLNLILAAST